MSAGPYWIETRKMAPDGAQSDGVFHALNLSRSDSGRHAFGFQRRGRSPINDGDYRAWWRAYWSSAATCTAVCVRLNGAAGRARRNVQRRCPATETGRGARYAAQHLPWVLNRVTIEAVFPLP